MREYIGKVLFNSLSPNPPPKGVGTLLEVLDAIPDRIYFQHGVGLSNWIISLAQDHTTGWLSFPNALPAFGEPTTLRCRSGFSRTKACATAEPLFA